MNMGLGPQTSAPGQFAGGFTPAPVSAPVTTEATGSAKKEGEEEAKGNTFKDVGFKMESLTVKEFIPKGVVVNTKEQFPDFDALDMDAPAPKKKKKGKQTGPVKVKVEPKEEEVDETTPWKGKKSEFFVMAQAATPAATDDPVNPMNLELSGDQWNFIFLHYPEYAASPYQMLSWLFTQAQQNEQIQQALYAKPASSGMGEDSEEDDRQRKRESKYDKGFGLPGQKNSKADTRKNDEEKKKALQKKEKEFYEKTGKVKKTDTEIKEEKKLKAFKDKDVPMNPEGMI